VHAYAILYRITPSILTTYFQTMYIIKKPFPQAKKGIPKGKRKGKRIKAQVQK